ncbi:fused MFS/spermidine synthase [Trichlorobacter lovleyi]|uniref:fused MFS/spermidine synthase n=1 Tax=Trichlorobacter lovleyi TaxID=313985 RepID=UPI00223FB29F|nr:fused MFS/spermidine synthase [Trichlorobacter lovleyi]QOX77776.1 fused MFS/spermidine synthase [Trichlorobacter lovleyi]
MRQRSHTVLCALFFLSGFVGLCYEICWIRSAGLIFGATTFAVSSVVALFFTGMAMGAQYFGSRSTRYSQPLKVYAFLEIGVGTFALFSRQLLTVCEIPYQLLYPSCFQHSIIISVIRVVLIALVIIPPTFLMGGTLPLFTQFYNESATASSGDLAFLYALNTIGAAAGCLICGFVLLPELGLSTTLLLIGLLAQGGGVLTLLLISRGAFFTGAVMRSGSAAQGYQRQFTDPAERGLLYATIFGTGFCVLSYEILWTRFLALITHNTVYTYTISLLTALTGIAVGSYLVHCRRPSGNATVLLGAVQILSAFFVLVSLLLPTTAWHWAASSESAGVIVVICLALMFIPTLFSGLSFPLLVDCIRHTDFSAGKHVGRVLATNTVGCVAGSMITGFILLPLLGMHATLLVITFVCLALGIMVIAFLSKGVSYRAKALVTLVSLLIWGLLATTTKVRLPADYLAKERDLIDFVEGKSAFISVIKRNGDTKMELDRMWQGQKNTGHQIMAAHLPMLLHPSAKEVLVVGIGAGQTPSRFLYYDITRLDCVDLESSIPDVLKKHFEAAWLSDPRTHVIAEDGNNYLRNIDKKYDLISVEVGQVFRPQASAFYTVEFYRHARQRLAKNGIISQFLPVGFFTEEQLKAVIKTFISEFPNSTLWYNHYAELLLIGSPDRNLSIDTDGVAVLRGNPKVFAELFFGLPGTEEHFLNNPEVLAASFMMAEKGLGNIAAHAPILSDDKPVLEYGTARTTYDPQRFKRLFEEQHESPQQIIAFAGNSAAVLQKITKIQHHYISNGFK